MTDSESADKAAEENKTTRRVDKDGNLSFSVSIGKIPPEMHDAVKEMAFTDKYSVGNIYSDAIIAMKKDYEHGNTGALLKPVSYGRKTQVWLREEADSAMRAMCNLLYGDNTSVVYTAMVRFLGYDSLDTMADRYGRRRKG